MPEITRKRSIALEGVAGRLKALGNKVAKAGWFETSRYEDGTQVAYVASIQEYGAHISHPGGTPYRIGPDGRAVFVSLSSPGAASLPKTKPHDIVIPPRPFMRPTIIREQQNWLAILASGARSVMAGKTTPENVMEAIGLRAAADIARSITLVHSPALKPATIRARLAKHSDKTTIGLLDKPLIDQGIMISSVTNIVENS